MDIRGRPGVTFFSDNTDFFRGNTFAQAPIYAVQGSILYTFPPIDSHNSLKLSASTGISTRTGSEFSAVGVAWQYRWEAGY
jgi:hypothetical protein